MAEFCLECSKKMGEPECGLAGLVSLFEWYVLRRAAYVICENCGPIYVDRKGSRLR